MTCFILHSNIACHCVCGEYLDANVHVLSSARGVEDLRCLRCCNVCSPQMGPWLGEAVTIGGEQGALWN